MLLDMTMILLVGAVCTLIFKKLKMPTIIGYLATGIILANYWVGESESTEIIVSLLADLGLVLLMFCIGMELNLKKLRKSGMFALTVVMIQVPLILLGGYIFGIIMGWSALQCIFFGAILSGSSTAAVTAVLAETELLSKEDVQTLILVTVVEDVAQVLILSMASPLLVGTAMSIESIIIMLGTIIVFMILSIFIGIKFIPKALDWIEAKMPSDILLISSLGLCFALSYVSVLIGMSMAIGAFIMGVIVSQAQSQKKIEEGVTPMKDIFMAMFFISIGLQISPNDLISNIGLVFLFFIVYAILKCSSVFVAYFIGNKTLRLSFVSAVSLTAMGEFAFIIAKSTYDSNLISQDVYSAIIGAALLSMICLPIFSKNANRIVDFTASHAPKRIACAVSNVTDFRNRQYSKLALSSKNTNIHFKKKLTLAYLDVLVLTIVLIIFYLGTEPLAVYIFEAIDQFSYNDCYTLILMGEFISLMIPLYMFVKNIKFVEKVFIDVERRAERLGVGDTNSTLSKFHKEIIKINNCMLVLFIDFIMLLFMPANVSIWTHVLIMVLGAGCLMSVYFYRYWIRS